MKTKYLMPSRFLFDKAFSDWLGDYSAWAPHQWSHALVKRAYAEVYDRI
jgi:hypothetical protein